MAAKYILFLSTNMSWGGSEVLWSQSVQQLTAAGYFVKAGAAYPYQLVKDYLPDKEHFIDLCKREIPVSRLHRLIQKTRLRKYQPKDILYEAFKQQKPDLVIISQGNNTEGLRFMKDCRLYSIPFVTITHLVTEGSWPGLNDDMVDDLRQLYRLSVRNFFVSFNTLLLHEKLLGEKAPGAVVVYNPFIKAIPAGMGYPGTPDNVYKVALIGRIEIYHKGYDLLIEVLKNKKWQERNIQFSLFGKGPHTALLNRLIAQNNINNFILHEHVENIAAIWETHHILMMPSRMEGQSLTLIEAMRFNRSAIVTNVGGATELIEDNVNGFVGKNAVAADIDDALERAWQQRSNWAQLGLIAGTTIAQKHPADALHFFFQEIEAVMKEKYLP